MIPFQGGTNEEVIRKMYKKLNAEGKQQNFKVYWYTSKDHIKPLNAAAKRGIVTVSWDSIYKSSTQSHIFTGIVKFCSIDDQVAIIGNGNQGKHPFLVRSHKILTIVQNK